MSREVRRPDEGWQLWETVSEGSPVSPVFPSPQQLASWITKNREDANAGGTSYADVLRWVTSEGWCPSGGVVGGRFLVGIELIVATRRAEQ